MARLIQEELEMGVIRRCHSSEVLFLNPIFLIKKASGEWRKIMDCRSLNLHISTPHFKMEDSRTLRDLILPSAWAVTLDLSHAYLHVPVHSRFAPFLGFLFEGQAYLQQTLCFGPSVSPLIFTKLLRAVIKKIRTFCTSMVYLDDIVMLANTEASVKEAAREALLLLRSLGLTVNFNKSRLIPSQQFTYLGFRWNTINMTVQVEERKRATAREEVKKFVRRVKQAEACSIRKFASLIGTLTSFSLAEPRALVHSRRMMHALSEAVKQGGWEGYMTISRSLLRELDWWNTTLGGSILSSIRPFVPCCTLTTDASEWAAGAVLEFKGEEQAFQQEWTHRQSRRSSNAREMMAVLKALQHFLLKDVDILVRTDNTTTQFDLNRRSSSLSLNTILCLILDLCHQRSIRLQAVYIPGKENVAADNLSRLYDSTDCRLSPTVFRQICEYLHFFPTLDAFASRWNAQCLRYYSLNREASAIGMNGLYHSWKGESGVYAYPPIPLIPRVLRKAVEERVPLLLITPDWETLPSIHSLRNLSIRQTLLPPARECVRMGPGMQAVGASIAPGRLKAWVL
jgi:hypothetical protein